MRRIHLILMRSRILDPPWKKWIRIRYWIQVLNISSRFTDFLKYVHVHHSEIWRFLLNYDQLKIIFCLWRAALLVLVDIFPLESDPDPDPGSQNVADPMDPDPKHCPDYKYF